MQRKWLLFVFLIGILGKIHFLMSADTQYWQRIFITHWKNDQWKFYSQLQFRFYNLPKHFRYSLLSPSLRYRALPWLDFELHYSWIESRTTPHEPLFPTHRLEFEINPFFKLNSCVTLYFRNRYELIKRHGTNKLHSTLRNRIKFELTFKNKSKLEIGAFHNETFYNLITDEFFENRLVPIELTYKLNKSLKISPYLMARTLRNTEGYWRTALVFGTNLNIEY
jgi:hypothetical protein